MCRSVGGKRMSGINCGYCGKFISYKSIEEDEAIIKRDHGCNGEPTDVYYVCDGCSKETE